ncbi:MAG TPA: nitroreductase [Quisquiliibacterium sp.]|nr:MAG: nitroreductase [Burkholderiaceae bacterium]HOA93536.1 nitroreductase [Quisquiliibacterium sp.]HPA88627.1 nitroreductase [Quisquiliibacterium sp.]HQD82491.1 nitroreductase [Quisquiliibacterium sp.]HQN14340.1 nitroreductase [Quisquiliibacterium sp.]
MDVYEAVASRHSIRAYLDRPVPPDTIRRVLTAAARAPSGGNLQPWHIDVVGGAELARLKAIMRTRVVEAPGGEEKDYDVYPKELVAPYRDYRFQVGEDMYGLLGIPREDKAARLGWFARNYQFFDAPLALFCTVDRRMGKPQWSDLGMYLQTVMLLLRAEGLDSCAQECWSTYPQTITAFLGTPAERMLFTGMAIGYADPQHPINRLVTRRAPLDDFATFRGI